MYNHTSKPKLSLFFFCLFHFSFRNFVVLKYNVDIPLAFTIWHTYIQNPVSHSCEPSKEERERKNEYENIKDEVHKRDDRVYQRQAPKAQLPPPLPPTMLRWLRRPDQLTPLLYRHHFHPLLEPLRPSRGAPNSGRFNPKTGPHSQTWPFQEA